MTAIQIAVAVIGLSGVAVSGVSSQGTGSKAKVEKIDALMKAYADQGKFNGSVLVADHGTVIYRKGFGWANAEWKIPNTPTTRFRIGSVTKQFTAMLVMQLVEEGKLRLDGTISDYIPEYPAGPGRAITIHQLLTHTSGLHNYTALPAFAKLRRTTYSPAGLLPLFDSLPLDFPPGTRWNYSNSGYITLGVIIETVTGEPYQVALKERILDPLKLKDTGYDRTETVLPNRADGYNRGFDGDQHADYLDMSIPLSAGGMYSTVEDLYRWDQALAARKLLSPASYQRYLAPQATIRPGLQYGYGWLYTKVERGPGQDSVISVRHNGGINGFEACNFTVPEDGIAIIWLDNTAQDNEIQEGITAILYGRPATPPAVSVAHMLYPVILRQGADSAVRRYHELKRLSPQRYDFSEAEVNLLGYHLLQHGRAAAAVQIFQLNAESYPRSGNAYDSLGEALLATGDTAKAVANYKRSLELDPSNQNAAQLLQRLGAR